MKWKIISQLFDCKTQFCFCVYASFVFEHYISLPKTARRYVSDSAHLILAQFKYQQSAAIFKRIFFYAFLHHINDKSLNVFFIFQTISNEILSSFNNNLR